MQFRIFYAPFLEQLSLNIHKQESENFILFCKDVRDDVASYG